MKCLEHIFDESFKVFRNLYHTYQFEFVWWHAQTLKYFEHLLCIPSTEVQTLEERTFEKRPQKRAVLKKAALCSALHLGKS